MGGIEDWGNTKREVVVFVGSNGSGRNSSSIRGRRSIRSSSINVVADVEVVSTL